MRDETVTIKRKTVEELDAEIDAWLGAGKTGAGGGTELAEAVSALAQDPEFEASFWKSMFVEQVLVAMEEQGVSRNELARRLDKSPQYVGRILNETANFTIDTMVKLAFALERKPCFGIHRQNERMERVPAVVRPGVFFRLPRTTPGERKKAGFARVKGPSGIKFGGKDARYSEVGGVSTDRFACQVA